MGQIVLVSLYMWSKSHVLAKSMEFVLVLYLVFH